MKKNQLKSKIKKDLENIYSFKFLDCYDKKVILKKTNIDFGKNAYVDRLFCYENKKIKRFFTNNNADIIRFYQQNKVCYFCLKNDKSYFYIENMDFRKKNVEKSSKKQRNKKNGKCSEFVFKLDFKVSDFELIDCQTIAIISDETDRKKNNPAKSYISCAKYRKNGSKFVNGDKSVLYIYDLRKKKLTQISENGQEAVFMNIRDDKRGIYYISGNKDIFETYNTPYFYDLKTGEKICLYDKEDCEFTYVDYLKGPIGNEKTIALATDMKSYGLNENPKFYEIRYGRLILHCDNDFSVENTVCSDVQYDQDDRIVKKDGEIYFLSTRYDRCGIYRMKDGKISALFDAMTCVSDYIFSGEELIIAGFKGKRHMEIFSVDMSVRKIEMITNCFSNPAPSSTKSTKKAPVYNTEKFQYLIDCGIMYGYIAFPNDCKADEKYPAVLLIHGGPKALYCDNFIYDVYMLTQNGYFVFYTNPHGSDGYGNEFADIRGFWGRSDYEDLMTFTDEVLKRCDGIDSEKLGVMGGSYGGFMVNTIISRTDRFKAAISQRGISDFVSLYGTSDIGHIFVSDQILHITASDSEKENNEFDLTLKTTEMNEIAEFTDKCFDPGILWEYSPVKYAKNVNTPLLIMHSDCDYRCPIEQATEFYTQLKLHGKDVKMVIYKGENHDLSREGSPKSRLERLVDIADFFERKLKTPPQNVQKIVEF